MENQKLINIISYLQHLVENYDLRDDLSGEEKKNLVMKGLEIIVRDNDQWIFIEPILDQTIELLISLSKNKIVLRLNKKIKKNCCHPF